MCIHRHCERSEAIQSRVRDSGLLRRFAPRNDGGANLRTWATPLLQRPGNPRQPLVDRRHLALQRLDLRSSVSLRLSPIGVNSASSKLCLPHLLQVEMTISISDGPINDAHQYVPKLPIA